MIESQSDETLRDLIALVEGLRHATPELRRRRYAAAGPLLRSLVLVRGDLASSRERVALSHEASWHIRCLAGLADGQAQGSEELHAEWALASLRSLGAGVSAPRTP